MKTSKKLAEYAKKRVLKASKEPGARISKKKGKWPLFVIQKHAARRLHYDLRLEIGGVLVSWAVPKGPSMNPEDKRLAIHVEDHPFAYKDFEGVIPSGYGAGKVIVWDEGTYSVDESPESEKLAKEGLKKGHIRVLFKGKKVKGEFHLVKFKDKDQEWLLIKKDDKYASKKDITEKDRSVKSRKKLENI